jgi:hypothetical protein
VNVAMLALVSFYGAREQMNADDLTNLVRRYLSAELQARTSPCMHRYRGIVREREVARRQREWIRLRTALEQAVTDNKSG